MSAQDKPTLQEILKRFGDIARQKRAETEAKGQDMPEVNQTGVTGQLLKPFRQDIGEISIMWSWEPLESCLVTGTLFLQDDADYEIKSGDYLVAIQYDGEPDNYYVFAKESSKFLAGALLSAYQWQSIWKENAGEFIEKELLSRQIIIVDNEVTTQ